jgi:hypothetical protein
VKFKSLLLLLSFLALLVFSAASTRSQTIITFDDIPLNTPAAVSLTNTYQGLVWSNCYIGNGILNPQIGAPAPPLTNGFYYGVVSLSNMAVMAFGGASEVDSPGASFNFLGAYLTGGWRSNLNIEVQGFTGPTLLYNTTVVASATAPTLFPFDYQNINRLLFSSSGGVPAFPVGGGPTNFAMDNFTFEFVPEPSPLLLATGGALLLWPLLKRKRLT